MNQADHMIAYWMEIALHAAQHSDPDIRACYLNIMQIADDYTEFVHFGTPLPSYITGSMGRLSWFVLC
jgi:hypothetical protein